MTLQWDVTGVFSAVWNLGHVSEVKFEKFYVNFQNIPSSTTKPTSPLMVILSFCLGSEGNRTNFVHLFSGKILIKTVLALLNFRKCYHLSSWSQWVGRRYLEVATGNGNLFSGSSLSNLPARTLRLMIRSSVRMYTKEFLLFDELYFASNFHFHTR